MSNRSLRPLWTWSDLCHGLTSQIESGPDISSVGVDSRNLAPGALFVALPGDPGPRFNPGYRSNVDGHDFVANAAAAGAAGALVHKTRSELCSGNSSIPKNFPLIQVNDTYDGLWALGRLARARITGDVIAVTGSSGKTTAKNFLSRALHAYAPPGSFNNHIGVPLSLSNTPADTQAAIYEIGTNHPGEVEPLAEMVAPEVAVLLNVHMAHIENFTDRDELFIEKTSIFNVLRDKSLAISEDILQLGYGRTFGESEGADARITFLQGDLATITLMGQRLQAKVPGGGLHRAKTLAATLLTCHLLGRDLTQACNLPPDTIPDGRGNVHRFGTVTLIDDSYNANPDSMQAALSGFADLEGPNYKIAVIGEMLELGEASAAAHMEQAPYLRGLDAVFCVGEGAQALAGAIDANWHAKAGPELCAQVTSTLDERPPGNAAIIVKGSNRVFWSSGFVQRLVDELDD